ncbi:hypothetical protein [Arthrobacter oryzae]|uniref:hypothetical protein n=1 Tax=Arthrobacter oryzae TaxID=409290 RepID=UPI00278977CE|nr:hypothetical protein [Arthrobacter oryzae]MDQ0078452.1 hypothetical protein [Arthrobacter oryzae]
MSEIVDQNVKKAGLNRRAVVKGAAWSLPVIAAAIAAPAASASGPTVTFIGAGSAVTYSGGNRSGTAPTGFRISGLIGAVSGTIIITPVGTVHARIGIQPASMFSTSAFDGNTSTTTYSAGTGTGQAIDISVGFFNLEDSAPNKPKPTDEYTYLMTVLLNGSPAVRAETNLTIRFK